ncbi:MAG TPA: amidase [Chthonomonadaceae bacterium]|nr:amidase [Chthonomonadaceae bacterium]
MTPKPKKSLTRKELLTSALAAAVGTAAAEAQGAPGPPTDDAAAAQAEDATGITAAEMAAAERVAAIELTAEQRAGILPAVRRQTLSFEALRTPPIPYTAEPATHFTPLGGGSRESFRVRATPGRADGPRVDSLTPDQIAFLSVRELSHLVRTRQIGPVDLTRLYLDRLKKYGDKLLCVITVTEELALRQADRVEKEIGAGRYRGPLHGIPYGIKDLFATRGIPTTWGAEPYERQVFDYDAHVVSRLEEAGAVLVAKLSMGALAMDDHWFRGKTKNPWNPKEGSSGSSAGSASATAAGLVGFSIGTETLGSITSPSHRCRVTGLRPTYGRVSRHGAMGLSYTMDKIGPICRDAEDCALVFAAICGHDPRDPTSVNRSFTWRPRVDYRRLKVGFLIAPNADPKDTKAMDGEAALQQLRKRGVHVRPVKFTEPQQSLITILEVEAASAFDALTRSPDLDTISSSAWPASFRTSRFVPAVEYLQAHRKRALAMQRFHEEFGDLDLFLAHGIGGYSLTLTNATGHPQVLVPFGQNEQGQNQSISLIGRLYEEDRLLAVAKAVQDAAPYSYSRLQPDLTVL